MEGINLYTSTYQKANAIGLKSDYFKPEHFENLYGNGNHRWTAKFNPNNMHKLDVLANVLQHRYPKKLTRSRVLALILNKVFDDLNITGDDD